MPVRTPLAVLLVLLGFIAPVSSAQETPTVSLHFSGAGQHVVLDSAALALTGDLTIEAWIRVEQYTLGGRFAQIVQREGSGSGADANALYTLALTADGRLDAFHESGLGTDHVALSAATVPLGRWVHVAEVRDAAAQTYRFFIDGVAGDAIAYAANPNGGEATATTFGAPSLSFVGQMDEVRIWNRALPEAEIQARMNAEIDPAEQTGLVGYWRFDDGPGTTTADLSGNGHTARLRGPAWSLSGPPFEGDGGDEGAGQPETDPQDDHVVIGPGQAVTVDVLANDTGEALSLVSVIGAAHGQAAIEDGRVAYRPDAGFAGVEVLTCTIASGETNTYETRLYVSVAATGAARIVIDEHFDDWADVPVLAHDTDDLPAERHDLLSLAVTNDEARLLLHLVFSDVVPLQEQNDLTLYLDTDNDVRTGTPLPGMGADLAFTFGARRGTFAVNGFAAPINHAPLGLLWLPTYQSQQFEVALALDAEVSGQRVFQSDTLRIVLAGRSGERLPHVPAPLAYVVDRTTALPEVEPASLAPDTSALRIVSWNVLRDNIFDGNARPAFLRTIRALQPDIIGFQEIYEHSGAETVALLDEALPPAPGERWYSGETGSDNILVSRYPVKASYPIGGNSAFLVDLPGADPDVLVFNAHTPCCQNEIGRREETDEIMQFVRKVRQGEVPEITAGTPFFIVGDLNMVGTDQPLRAMLTGDISDNATYGADFNPDWDESPLADARPRHLTAPVSYTWTRAAEDFVPGRLDFILYTDSKLLLTNAFVLHTPRMPEALLSAAGLLAGDTDFVSDHLPVVGDFVFTTSSAIENEPGTSRFKLLPNVPNPFAQRTDIRFVLPQSGPVSVRVYDVLGRLVATLLDRKSLLAGPNAVSFEGGGLPSGVYVYRVETPEEMQTGRVLLRR